MKFVRKRFVGLSLVVGMTCWVSSMLAQEPVSGEKSQGNDAIPATKSAAAKPPKVARVAPGLYRVADHVLLDVNKREISFPAVCNQVSGLVEYALVHETGKTHESLFRTKVKPRTLQATLLLARVQSAAGFVENLWKENPEAMDVSASRLGVAVSWQGKGGPRKVALESMVANSNTKKAIASDSFVFNGSRFVGNVFMAEESGSIIAVYADDTAMINNGDHDADNDEVWIARKEAMPPLDLPVTITLKFPSKKLPSKQ